MTRPIIVIPDDSDEDVTRLLKLGLAVSYTSTALETDGHLWGSIRIWNKFYAQAIPDPKPPAPVTGNAGSKRVGFAVPTNTPAISIHNTLQPYKGDSDKIVNLCQVLRKSQELGAGECCGHITDDSRSPCPMYEIHSSGDADVGSVWCLVSLRDVRSGEAGLSPPSLYGDKLRLAWVISSSVLQLQDTPWLPGTLTYDEIFLVKKNDILFYHDVFLLRRFPET